MKIEISYELNENYATIKFKNDPLIEEFFKTISQNKKNTVGRYNIYYLQSIFKEEFYYNIKQVKKPLSDKRASFICALMPGSSKKTVSVKYEGLISENDLKDFMNYFSIQFKDFVESVIKPYYYLKKYIVDKGHRLEGNYVVNDDGYKREWMSYFNNYKKYILPKIEVKS